jgi:hypothetical protein
VNLPRRCRPAQDARHCGRRMLCGRGSPRCSSAIAVSPLWAPARQHVFRLRPGRCPSRLAGCRAGAGGNGEGKRRDAPVSGELDHVPRFEDVCLTRWCRNVAPVWRFSSLTLLPSSQVVTVAVLPVISLTCVKKNRSVPAGTRWWARLAVTAAMRWVSAWPVTYSFAGAARRQV